MPLAAIGRAPRRRSPALPLAAALAAAALGMPSAAQAADNLGPGGVTAAGSALTVGVSGAPGTDGAIEARFSGVDAPLFWGVDPTNMNDQTAAYFALNTPSGLYSPQPYSTDNQPFTQLSAPVRTGTGTAGDPYVITSRFRATSTIDITQTVTHVSGTTSFLASWAVHNGGGATTAMQAFEGADMYVDQNDNGTGTSSGSQPNRVIGSVSSDGTAGYIREQSTAPWTHYFSGMNSPFYNSTSDSTFGSLPDTIDPTVQDSGMGVEWDFTLAANATKTYAVEWSFTAPAAPQAPAVTNLPTGVVATTTAAPHFGAAPGDTQVAGYECAVDDSAFSACSSPASVSGLAEGSHSYAVRAVNSARIPGPATTRTWTVDTVAPAAPTLTGAPAGMTSSDGASITFSGEEDATFRCSIDGGTFVGCGSPLVLSGLADGTHQVKVKQVDEAGNSSTSWGSATWTVDTTVPTAPAAEAPAESTATTATVEFTVGSGMTAECSLDGDAFAACTSPYSATGLSAGAHTLKVRQVNGAGTAGAAKTLTWNVLAPPVTDPPVTVDTPAPSAPAAPVQVDVAPTPPATAPAESAATSAADAPLPVCVSTRKVLVHWRLPAGRTVQGFEVTVDGKVSKRLKAGARQKLVDLSGRAASTVKVEIKTIGGGKTLSSTRIYKVCSGSTRDAGLASTMLIRNG